MGSFPAYLHLLGWRVHPHPFFELIAYSGGFQFYRALRRRSVKATQLPASQIDTPRTPASPYATLWIITGALLGALCGAKVLAWVESPHLYLRALHDDPRLLLGGKTIVGGLLGGWGGVEIAKRCLGITHSTGDIFVFPLIFGMAVGRIGCFLTGLSDQTWGLPTTLPWGVVADDGLPHHPAPLYEMAFLLLLAGGLALAERGQAHPSGWRFRVFLLAYLVFRFGIEFIKPRDLYPTGLSAIQMACVLGILLCAWSLRAIGAKLGKYSLT